ncbi:UNKNOWN [Stylonychia lemnae]|uniref:Uncharacterized protein n=1 Tax=Stylonychia lemnae TaxID=5949 RepID=A0A078ARA5_STYLE|nr:UNKNOWN [Stylonychia lemnae]|eukprot:CDW84754.1 UNKNOWN [Stylonychia lemnae]
MGNRNVCGFFPEMRREDDKFSIDGLNYDENAIIKQIYTSMGISNKEVSMVEFKRNLDVQMIFMRKRKLITPNMDQIYDYIDVLLDKDMRSNMRYRIGLNEFMVLWQNALHEKKLEDRRQWKDIKYKEPERENMCYGCLLCQKRDKIVKSEMSAEFAPTDLKRQQSDAGHTHKRGSGQSSLERSDVTSVSSHYQMPRLYVVDQDNKKFDSRSSIKSEQVNYKSRI